MRGVVLEGRAVRLRSKRFVHTAVDRRPTNRIEPLRPHQPPPVSRGWPTQVLNMASTFHSLGGDTSSPRFQKHLLRVADYLWVSEDGMKMQGYNGSQGWDASFVMQALAEADLVDEYASMCSKAYSYLERTQVRGRPLTAHGHQFSLPTATSFHCPRPPVSLPTARLLPLEPPPLPLVGPLPPPPARLRPVRALAAHASRPCRCAARSCARPSRARARPTRTRRRRCAKSTFATSARAVGPSRARLMGGPSPTARRRG